MTVGKNRDWSQGINLTKTGKSIQKVWVEFKNWVKVNKMFTIGLDEISRAAGESDPY